MVSGGASGLGAATARALARRGAPVAILDLDADRGARGGGRDRTGSSAPTDVTDPAAVAAALDRAAAAHGAARIAVACAGIAPAARSVDREGRPHDAGAVRAGDRGQPARHLQPRDPGRGADGGGAAAERATASAG